MDKLKKIIYIISGTLSIMLMVFLLMHKVGLCANVSPTDYVTEFPLPYGAGSNYGYGDFPLTDDIIQGAIDTALDFHPEWGFFTEGYCVLVHEIDTENNIIVFHIRGGNSFGTVTSTSLQDEPSIGTTSGKALLRVKYDNGSFSVPYYVTTEYPSYISLGLQNLPTSGKYLPSGVFLHNYPVAFSDSFNLTYSNQLLFQKYVVSDTGFNSDDYVFSDYNNLPDSPSSGDTDYSLYQWLNGQNKNNYDYTKSIFDLLKGFFSWVVAPPDNAFIEGAWDNTDLGGVVNYVSGLGDTLKSILGNGAQAPETLSFNCSISLLGQTFPYTVDFSWYQQIKTQFLTVFLTFFYVGAFLYFIKSIPSFINGVSGTMNNFTQAGGGSDD